MRFTSRMSLRASVRTFGFRCRGWQSSTRLAAGLLEDGFFNRQAFRRLAAVPSLNPNLQEGSLRVCKYAAFFDPGIYEAARRNLYKREARSDGSLRYTIPRVIEQMKNRSFQFEPVESRTPSLTDQVVQEAFRVILEPAFVHARPPDASAQATLRRLRRTWTGTTWMISVAGSGLLDDMDHAVLGSLIMRGVGDQQLLDVYWKLVRAGLVSSQGRHNLTGVSKGGILWPLFTDIYLSVLDVWLKEYASQVSGPSKVRYVRYGDQWVVGVEGPKSLAVQVRDEIRSHLSEALKVQIEEESVSIAHLASEKVKFLGVLVGARDRRYVESLVGDRARRAYGRIVLEAPVNEIVTKLVEQGFAASPEFPRGMSGWIHLEAEEILRRYTRIVRGLMAYYSEVDNRHMMRRVFWLLRFSAIFTLCRKWRVSTRALFKKMANHPQFGDFFKGRITSW